MASTLSPASSAPVNSDRRSRGRSGARPRMRPKLGTGTLRINPAAHAIGAPIATAAQAIDSAQPPTPKLSTGTFATAQPISVPETTAINVTPSQRPGGGTDAVRLAAAPATPNTKAASSAPPAACQRQPGWFDTGAPQVNLGVRAAASNRPQWPPTVPSSRRFQGWSNASMTLTR